MLEEKNIRLRLESDFLHCVAGRIWRWCYFFSSFSYSEAWNSGLDERGWILNLVRSNE